MTPAGLDSTGVEASGSYHGSMSGDADIATVGSLLADPGRARILMALADGRSLPAGMLAAEAGVTAATASSHLAKLRAGGLLAVTTRGRYRYYGFSGPAVAELVEAVARVAPTLTISSLREGSAAHALRLARRCYDHLAGRVGVAVTAALVERGCLDDGDSEALRVVTGCGQEVFDRLGVDIRPGAAVRCCVDWTEQRPHVAGPLGRGLLTRFAELGWLRERSRGRALHLTEAGRVGLTGLGVRLPA